MSKDDLKPGDTVGWDSSGGHSVGHVVKRVTSRTIIKKHKVAASEDNPEYLVKSNSSGRIAAHKPAELKRT